MKFNYLKSITAIALISGIFGGCIKDDNFEEPVTECAETNLVANTDVSELTAIATGLPAQYTSTTEDIIEAYVTSSDERGNFFKSVSFQTNPTDGSAPIGFSVAIDDTSLFAKKFTVGRKVFVKLNDLYFATVDGSLKIGQLYESSVGRIAEAEYAAKVIPSCVIVDEDELVRTLTITQAMSNSNLNTLIQFENVQFKDEFVGGTYYDPNDDLGGASNRLLVDAAGNEIIFRTSSYANFSGNEISEKSGTVRGVLTKYGSDFQFLARFESDINLTNPRIVDEPVGPVNPNEPSDDAPWVFPGGDFEDFSAFLGGLNTSFPIQSYATQGAGTGLEGSNSLHIMTAGAGGNDYVFSTFPHAGLPATYTRLQFYVKGSSAKSISINLYKLDGTYYRFNLGDVTGDKIIPSSTSNQYTGTINTAGEWALITLNLTGITDLNFANMGANLFALKIGSASNYDLHLDNFTIE